MEKENVFDEAILENKFGDDNLTSSLQYSYAHQIPGVLM